MNDTTPSDTKTHPAWKAGFRAFQEGRKDCPHKHKEGQFNAARAAWWGGWLTARTAARMAAKNIRVAT